ncbi:MAG: matrixin family metalloprotease [Bdellovibrionia bacterium]
MKKTIRVVSLLLLASFTLGFRVYPGDVRWTVSVTDPVIWIRMCERPEFSNNDFPSGDPLANQVLTFNSVLTSVKDDYNNVTTSFVEFRDTGVDTGFDPATARIIDVCFGGVVLASGYAQQRREEGHIVGCDIKLADKLKSSAKQFAATLVHELGHCMGLDHTQDLTYAVMSYFRDRDLLRLQIDDKMGLTYGYPQDPEYGKESATLGLTCN